MQAIDIREVGDKELLFTWGDETRTLLSNRLIRYHCGCAGCIDEMTGKRRIREEDVAPDIKPLRIENVGNYAIKIHWSDGHNTGIYSFELLRTLKG